MLHEFIHGQERHMAVCHSYLYGYGRLYTRAQERLLSPKRYQVPSSLLKAMEWVFLKSKLDKLLLQLQAQLTAPKKKYKYFTESEVEGLNHEFVLLLDKARGIAGIPFKINSGFRTKEHNKAVGGVKNSAHLGGLAIDANAKGGSDIYIIVYACMQVGIKRIGINWDKHFVHIDVDYSKPTPTIYKY